jgi:Flp pilus assembly CpaF family ATPase
MANGKSSIRAHRLPAGKSRPASQDSRPPRPRKTGQDYGDSARDEVLVVIRNAINGEVMPLSFAERERLSREILDEIFGLARSSRCSRIHTVSDILVNRFDRVYIERAGKIELTPVLQRQHAPHADHRAHRFARRPPGRRIFAHG